MASDIETAIFWSQELEALLESRLGAIGRGLHEKTDSVAAGLPATMVRDLHRVAAIRNTLVHEKGAVLPDRNGFERTCGDLVSELEKLDVSQVPAPLPSTHPMSRPSSPAVSEDNTSPIVVALIPWVILQLQREGFHPDLLTKPVIVVLAIAVLVTMVLGRKATWVMAFGLWVELLTENWRR